MSSNPLALFFIWYRNDNLSNHDWEFSSFLEGINFLPTSHGGSLCSCKVVIYLSVFMFFYWCEIGEYPLNVYISTLASSSFDCFKTEDDNSHSGPHFWNCWTLKWTKYILRQKSIRDIWWIWKDKDPNRYFLSRQKSIRSYGQYGKKKAQISTFLPSMGTKNCAELFDFWLIWTYENKNFKHVSFKFFSLMILACSVSERSVLSL